MIIIPFPTRLSETKLSHQCQWKSCATFMKNCNGVRRIVVILYSVVKRPHKRVYFVHLSSTRLYLQQSLQCTLCKIYRFNKSNNKYCITFLSHKTLIFITSIAVILLKDCVKFQCVNIINITFWTRRFCKYANTFGWNRCDNYRKCTVSTRMLCSPIKCILCEWHVM